MKRYFVVCILLTVLLTGCPKIGPHGYLFRISYEYKIINNSNSEVSLKLQPLLFKEKNGQTEWELITEPGEGAGNTDNPLETFVKELAILPNQAIEFFDESEFYMVQGGFYSSESNTFLITISTDGTVFHTLAGYPEAGNENLKPGDWYTEPETDIVPQTPDQYALGFGDLRGVFDLNEQTGNHHLYSESGHVEKTNSKEINVATAYYTITVDELENVSAELTGIHNLTLVNDVSGNRYQG